MIGKLPPPSQPLRATPSLRPFPPPVPSRNGLQIRHLGNDASREASQQAEVAQSTSTHGTRKPVPTAAARWHRAVTTGDVASVKALIEADVDFNAGHEDNDPPLLLAMRSAHRNAGEIVELLVIGGADTNVESLCDDGATPIALAIRDEKHQLLSFLLANPETRIHRADRTGISPYQRAEQNATDDAGEEIFRLIKAHDKKYIQECSSTEERAEIAANPAAEMCRAAAIGDLNGVHRLLERGLGADPGHEWHDPPLYIAARTGGGSAGAIADILLRYGANPNNARGYKRTTPLITAIKEKQVQVVSALLSRWNINVHQADATGISAYGQAQRRTVDADSTRIFNMIKDHHEANAHVATSAWFKAAAGGKLDKLRELHAQYGRDIVESVNRSSYTALWTAAGHNRSEVVKQLLQWGANADFHNGDGVTVLHNARNCQALEVVAILEAHQAARRLPR